MELKTADVARLLQVKERAVQRAIKEGRLPAHRRPNSPGHGAYVIHLADLLQYKPRRPNNA